MIPARSPCAIPAARASASTCRSRERSCQIGKGRVVREGTRIAILSLGTRLGEALKAADELAARGLSTTVADARFAKPLDRELILRLAATHKLLITVEEGCGRRLRRACARPCSATPARSSTGLRCATMTLPDKFQDHDKPDACTPPPGSTPRALSPRRSRRSATSSASPQAAPREPILDRTVRTRPRIQAGAAISPPLLPSSCWRRLATLPSTYIDHQRKMQNCLDSGRRDCEHWVQ